MNTMKKIIGFVILLLQLTSGMTQTITEVKGYAPTYVGQKIELFEIEDYFSMRESLLATTIVAPDSSFSFQFYNDKTQKIIVKSAKNKGFIYIQPQGKYEVFVPSKNPYDPYREQGNQLEISFFNLDSTDINYKILSFDKWINNFLGYYFPSKKMNGTEFAFKLEEFKSNVEKAYASDTSLFFKTYVKYSIASLDDIQFVGSRNRYEKFDFYINGLPVVYESDIYMNYLSSFYENMLGRLEMEVNNRVYLGLLKNSPSLIMRALADEYTLRPVGTSDPKKKQFPANTKLRELIMIKALADVFYSSDYPQTNIINVLDSVSKHSIFKSNGIVAKNLIYRLTELVPGSKAPDFALINAKGNLRSLSNYGKKHVYIHVFDPTSKQTTTDLELLKVIHQKYKGDVQFVSIFEKKDKMTKKQKELIDGLPWDTFFIENDDPFLKMYHVETFPTYILIDGFGYIVNVPALGPQPNGDRITIDKIFFDIKKINETEK